LAFRRLQSIFLQPLIFGILLFVPAGTLHWWRAWVFLGVVFVASATTMFTVFHEDNDELLKERFKLPLQKGQPFADKIILMLVLVSFVGQVVFIPLDVFHFRLMGQPNIVVASLGLVMFAGGWTVTSLAMVANRFAAPVVRYQEERHQRVIDNGVYRFVRHPMYSGAVLLIIGQALWLGSYAGAVAAAGPILVLAARILFEERFLNHELAGYCDYVARTPYRLIPFVW
jgi:protein-S-isoprenylcysteine O-methyltransferase Ste14